MQTEAVSSLCEHEGEQVSDVHCPGGGAPARVQVEGFALLHIVQVLVQVPEQKDQTVAKIVHILKTFNNKPVREEYSPPHEVVRRFPRHLLEPLDEGGVDLRGAETT